MNVVGSAVWRWFVVAHLVAVVVGFGPLFVYPLVTRALRREASDEARAAGLAALTEARRRVSEPAFVAVLPLGLTAALLHPDDALLGRAWLQVAIAFFVIAVAFVLVVQRPLSRRVARAAAAGDGAELATAVRWLTRATWVSWVGLVVMLWLMLFQPGG